MFVVRSVFHCALGKRKNVRSSSPPSRRLDTTPGHRLLHVRSKAACAVRAVSVDEVHDQPAGWVARHRRKRAMGKSIRVAIEIAVHEEQCSPLSTAMRGCGALSARCGPARLCRADIALQPRRERANQVAEDRRLAEDRHCDQAAHPASSMMTQPAAVTLF